MFNKYPLVYVEWEDHSGDDSWKRIEEIDIEPTICKSVGWMLKQDDKSIVIFTCINNADDVQVGGVNFILKSCIREFNQLRVVKKKEKPKEVPKNEGV